MVLDLRCLFIRGFRVARRLKILSPELKAAAGYPDPKLEGYDPEPDVELISIPAVPVLCRTSL